MLARQNGSPQVATQPAVTSSQAAPNGKVVKGLVRSLGVMNMKPNKIAKPKNFGPECISEDEISVDDEREFPPASSEVAQEESVRHPVMPRFSRASQASRKKKVKRPEDDIDIDKIVREIEENNVESERRRLEKAVAQAIVEEATQLEASETQSRLLEKRTMVRDRLAEARRRREEALKVSVKARPSRGEALGDVCEYARSDATVRRQAPPLCKRKTTSRRSQKSRLRLRDHWGFAGGCGAECPCEVESEKPATVGWTDGGRDNPPVSPSSQGWSAKPVTESVPSEWNPIGNKTLDHAGFETARDYDEGPPGLVPESESEGSESEGPVRATGDRRTGSWAQSIQTGTRRLHLEVRAGLRK